MPWRIRRCVEATTWRFVAAWNATPLVMGFDATSPAKSNLILSHFEQRQISIARYVDGLLVLAVTLIGDGGWKSRRVHVARVDLYR